MNGEAMIQASWCAMVFQPTQCWCSRDVAQHTQFGLYLEPCSRSSNNEGPLTSTYLVG
jgi:hypothetical protein